MKLSIAFAIALSLAVAFLPIASPSLTAKDAHDSSTVQASGLTSDQEDALKVLALDDETHKKVVDRADPLKVAKFIELHELFKSGNFPGTLTESEEIFDLATAYVPCEIAWHLRIIEFGETIQCFEKSASWKVTSKVGDKVLVNFFADKHAFELIQLLKTTDIGEEVFLNIQKLLSLEGVFPNASIAFFLQHALALHKQDPTSLEREEMVKSFLSLHLSAIATMFTDEHMIKTLYTKLAQNVPTLFAGILPEHTIAVVVTRTNEDEYDIVIVNSGHGIGNHESTTEIQPKGFHTGASYDDVSTDMPIEATSYNPLLRMEGVTGAELASAHYHSGTMEQVYHDVLKNGSSHVVTEPLMPWEWTEEQGIGTCTATSVWFALHYYYQALGYENDIRLSILDQAVGDLKELQNKVEGLERQMTADYQKAWEAFKSAGKDKKDHFHYDQGRVKDLTLAKDEAEKSLHLRRAIISMALNEILRNLIVWQHELGDIKGDLLIKDKDPAKMEQRQRVLERAIPQSMESFHGFWAHQEEKCLKRQGEIAGTEATLSSVLDSWHSIRADVRTMYNDAIRVTGIRPEFETALAKRAIAKQTLKPIDVASLKEHASLRKILGYITNFGDSPDLRKAISTHFETHTKNAYVVKYLVVLHACLARNVPLLDHLVVEQELPLFYIIDTKRRDPKVAMYWDLTTEDSIAALAAHEFVQHGQPLDVFPELFAMSKRETRGIISKFKDAYEGAAPIINAEAPWQDEVDEAFKGLVESDLIAAIAYILPKTSRKTISDAFSKTESVRALRLLVDWVQDPELLKEKIEASITNVGIVALLLPFHLGYEKHAMERDLIEKQGSGSTVAGEPAKASLPDRWLETAYDEDAVKVMELLAPFASESAIKDLILRAAAAGKSEMAHTLSKFASDGAIFAVMEGASTHSHGDLAKALFEEYARKKPTEIMFLKASEQGSLDDLERLMPSVSADTIGYALFKAAEKGEMGCFEKLVPHATDKSIDAALPKLSDKDLKHPSVLKAVNNASRLSAYTKVVERATKTSSAELAVHMLPFMFTAEVNRFFKVACENPKSFEIAKRLLQFADNDSVAKCLEAAINRKMEDSVVLLLPRVNREKLAEIVQSLEFKKLDEATRQAAADRIKGFAREVAIELAFLPKDDDGIRDSLQGELEKYNVESGKDKDDLACTDQEPCIVMMDSMNPEAVVFPVEQAIERRLRRREDSAALEKLAPFATPYACTQIMRFISDHGSKEATVACAKKALKPSVSITVELAQEKDFELMKLLVPSLSPLGIIGLLEPRSSTKQVDADHLKAALADLPRALADDALRIAVRGSKETREESVHYLLPMASQAAIDEVYLYAKRIEFDDEPLEKAASETAKDQGNKIEKARQIK